MTAPSTATTQTLPANMPGMGYVDTAQAAEFTGMSESWLEHDRLKTRPEIPFSRFGTRAVRYLVADLIAYGQSRSTAKAA